MYFSNYAIDADLDELDHNYPYSAGRCDMTHDCSALSKYLCGGRGIVTLQNSVNHKHRTYEFRKPNNINDFACGTIFVYALRSDKQWKYVGMYDASKHTFKLTRASTFSDNSEIVRGAKFIVSAAVGKQRDVNGVMRIYHEGICAVCGRKLTQPKSIQAGIGPTCKKSLELAQ